MAEARTWGRECRQLEARGKTTLPRSGMSFVGAVLAAQFPSHGLPPGPGAPDWLTRCQRVRQDTTEQGFLPGSKNQP